MTNPPTAGRDGPAFVADDCGGKGRRLGLLLGLMSIFVIGLALQLSGLLGSSSASAAPLGASGGVVPSPLGVTGPITVPGLENMAMQQVQPKGGLFWRCHMIRRAALRTEKRRVSIRLLTRCSWTSAATSRIGRIWD